MGEQKYSYMGRQRDSYMIDTQTDRDRLRLKDREATRQADKETPNRTDSPRYRPLLISSAWQERSRKSEITREYRQL